MKVSVISLQVTHRDLRAVRAAAIEQHLHRTGLAGGDLAREVLRDAHREHRLARFDRVREFLLRVDRDDLGEGIALSNT